MCGYCSGQGVVDNINEYEPPQREKANFAIVPECTEAEAAEYEQFIVEEGFMGGNVDPKNSSTMMNINSDETSAPEPEFDVEEELDILTKDPEELHDELIGTQDDQELLLQKIIQTMVAKEIKARIKKPI